MKQCAVILNGSDVVKVGNLPRKYPKFANNPDVKILEECDENELEEKYAYWRSTIKHTENKQTENPLKYHWRNKITGHTLHSIYPELNKYFNPDEWESYEITL